MLNREQIERIIRTTDPKDLTPEDVKILANAPLSVTTAYHKAQDVDRGIKALRVKYVKLKRKKAQEACLAEIEVYEKDLQNILANIEG